MWQASTVVSRVAPLMTLPTIVLRPECGSARVETLLRTETDVWAGDGASHSPLNALASEGLHNTSLPTTAGATLQITLEDDDWVPSLLQYVDQQYEVCVHPVADPMSPSSLP